MYVIPRGFESVYMTKAKDKKKKKKKTALVMCRDRKEFWTTQKQFWQWVREGVVTKTGDNPLTGAFRRDHEELMVLVSNTVLNLAHPNHIREALLSLDSARILQVLQQGIASREHAAFVRRLERARRSNS